MYGLVQALVKSNGQQASFLLDEIIFDEHSAFVLGRLITNNVVIVYECIHYLWNRKGKQGARTLKLGMAKAYNRIKGRYFEAVMPTLGFSHNWCTRVMKCVTSIAFSIRVNGFFSPSFTPSRDNR